MRKILAIAVAVMLLPFTAFGLEMLADDVLSDVTGQAGVSIAVDDIKLFQHIESLRYTDNDGLGGASGAASIGIADLSMMVDINGVTKLDANGNPYSPNRDVLGDYASYKTPAGAAYNFNNYDLDENGTDEVFAPRALTIDVSDTLPVLSEAAATKAAAGIAPYASSPVTNVAGVQIGLPTVEVHMSALTFDITVESKGSAINTSIKDADGNVLVETGKNSFGNISIGNQTLLILDGVIEIAPH